MGRDAAGPEGDGGEPQPPRSDIGSVDAGYTGSGPRVLVLGDSITHSSRAQIAARLQGHAVRVGAVVGEGLAPGPWSEALGRGGMVEVAEGMAGDDPDVVVIALGTNDAWNPNLTLPSAEAGLRRLVELFPHSCLVTVAIVESPAADGYDGDEARAINRLLAGVADVVVPWGARAEAAGSRYLSDDGIHLTPEGQEMFADLVGEAVESCLG